MPSPPGTHRVLLLLRVNPSICTTRRSEKAVLRRDVPIVLCGDFNAEPADPLYLCLVAAGFASSFRVRLYQGDTPPTHHVRRTLANVLCWLVVVLVAMMARQGLARARARLYPPQSQGRRRGVRLHLAAAAHATPATRSWW